MQTYLRSVSNEFQETWRQQFPFSSNFSSKVVKTKPNCQDVSTSSSSPSSSSLLPLLPLLAMHPTCCTTTVTATGRGPGPRGPPKGTWLFGRASELLPSTWRTSRSPKNRFPTTTTMTTTTTTMTTTTAATTMTITPTSAKLKNECEWKKDFISW